MTQKFTHSKTLTLAVAAAFFVYAATGCQHSALLNDALESRASLSAPLMNEPCAAMPPFSNFSATGATLSDSAKSATTAQSDEMQVPNRTGLTILAIGAVALIIATPILLSGILSSGSRPQSGNDDKVGISAASEAQGR